MNTQKAYTSDPAMRIVDRIAKRWRVPRATARLIAERAGFRPVCDTWQPLAHVAANVLDSATRTMGARDDR